VDDDRRAPPGETEADPPGDPMEEAFLRDAAGAPPEEPPPRLIGTTLGRRYRIGSLLGKGGMGVVYYAQDTKLRRPVALKVLPPALVADAERRRRFLREARSAAAVTHPGIAAVYDVGEDAGNVFLAMEYVPGQNLRSLIRERRGGMPSALVARIGCDIAVALHKAHGVGVIHRDLKPENVMLSEDGIVKILDFGLAKLRETEVSAVSETATVGHATEAGRVMGTPHYMSPEQALGRPVDERTDIFSLGVMLYELCSGQLPFGGVTDMEAIVARTRDEPKPLQSISADVSEDLVRVIDRCLRKDAAQRYASAAALVAELRPIAAPSIEGLVTQGGSHLSVPPAALPSRPHVRRRWPWLGLAALLAAGATAFAVLGSRDHGTPLAHEGSLLACPILETEDASQGWLGAAAAHIACERAATLLGRLWDHALTPAMLLDLPRQPVDSFPEEPFGATDARARTLDAARSRAAAYLDGRVVATDRGFRVSLVLKEGDRTLGQGQGSGEALWQAVRAAMVPLIGPDAIPQAARNHPNIAAWTRISDVDLYLAAVDFGKAIVTGTGTLEERAKIEPRRVELGVTWTLLSFFSALYLGEMPDVKPPDIDRSSPQTFAATAAVHAHLGGNISPAALADELKGLRQKMTDPLDRRSALHIEAEIRLRAGDNDGARNLVLSALRDEPRLGWFVLAYATHSRIGQVSVARAHTAWEPDNPMGWNSLGFMSEGATPQKKLEFMRRAYALGPGFPLNASQLGRSLVLAGEREEARALAARLASGDARLHFVGEGLTVEVEASEGRLATALARAQKALLTRPDFGGTEGGFMMWPDAAELAMVLGRQAELAEAFARAFVLVEPPRLRPDPQTSEGVVLACALASPATAATCFARIRKLIEAGYFHGSFERTAPFLAGAERYAQRDYKGAAAAWRALANEPPSGRTWLILGDAFDRAGDPEIAERIDKQGPYMGLIGGLSIAHLRMARRAAARGDAARARELAQKIVDAWGVADAPVPAVQEMRALLTRLR